MHRVHAAVRAAIVLATFAGLAAAQQADDDGILHVQAGGTRAVQSPDGAMTKWLSNGLRAWQGDAELTAQEGVLYSDPVRIVIHGDADFRDSTRTITADTLMYYESTREAFAIGNVVVRSTDRRLTADRLHYRRLENLIDATGNVAVVDDSLHASMSGGEAVFNDSTRYGLIIGEPVLMREDDDGSLITISCDDTIEVIRRDDASIARLWPNVIVTRDSLRVYADRAEYHGDTEDVVLTGDPLIVIRDSLTVYADHANYNVDAEVIVLTGEPFMQYLSVDNREDVGIPLTTTSVLKGDTIRVYLEDREFSGAYIEGAVNGVITAIDSAGVLYDSTIIDCNTMHVELADKRISLISAAGQADSYYHRRAVDTTRMFVNVASGDTLNFYFNEGQVENLRIFGSGGGLGRGRYYSYTPEPDSSAVSSESSVD